MKKLGKYKMYYWHRRLWSYLAATGDRTKTYWPGWIFNLDIENNCFPCHYALQRCGDDDDHKCRHCPFQWPNNINCQMNGSLWYNWIFGDPDNKYKRKKLANKICYVPLKPYPLRKLADYNKRFNLGG